MIRKVFLILVAHISFFFSQAVTADAPSLNEPSRSKAMGGAGSALRGSLDSPMMNPASLQDLEGWTWTVFNFTAEAPFNVGLLSSLTDFKDVANSKVSDDVKRAAFEDLLRDLGTESLATRVNFYPSFTSKYLHVGILVDALVNPRFRVKGLTSNQLVEMGGSNVSGGLILSSSYSFLENQLQVGATLKPIYRAGLSAQQQQTLLDVLRAKNEGGKFKNELFGTKVTDNAAFGIGFDLGAKYWIPYWRDSVKPSVSLTYQDIGNTRFFSDNSLPADIKQSLSLGLALHPSYRFMDFAVAVDGRNLTEKQELLNYLHFGFEAMFWKILALRGGVSQGYLTGGLGLTLEFFQFDAFVSAEEVGEYARLQAQRTFGFRFAFNI